MKKFFGVMLLVSGAVLAGCEKAVEDTASPISHSQIDSQYDRNKVDKTRVKQGRELYLKNCTVCHGLAAEGDPDWRKRDADGKYPAPPLNGTGHAWHHPKKALMYTIKNGTKALGGNMPAWKERLTDEEIESIILWFQSKWPDELYQAWVRRDQEMQNN